MSNAENELKEQLPFYFRPIVEYGEILKVQGHVLDQLEDNMTKVSANNYISSCDEATIAYYEIFHFQRLRERLCRISWRR